MYRGLAILVMVAACSSDTRPGSSVEVDAATTDTNGGDDGGAQTSDEMDASSTTTDTSSETSSDGQMSSTATDDDGGTSGDAPDVEAGTDGGLAQCEPLSEASCEPAFDCASFSEASYSQAVADVTDRCGEFVSQSIHTGEGCGYLIVKYAFGAGDTFMAFYDTDSHDVVGWKFMDDTNTHACAGEVPAECYEYGLSAPLNGVDLCPDAGADASPDGASPDADVPDADAPDADVSDAESPDSPLDGSVDASDAN